MALDSHIMDLVRRAKAKYDEDLAENGADQIDDAKTDNFCEATVEGRQAILAGLGDTIDTEAINWSAHEMRRAEYVYTLNTALDELELRGLSAEMIIAPDDAPGVANLLRRLAWALDSLADFDAAQASRVKPRVRVPARTSNGNVIPFPGSRSNH